MEGRYPHGLVLAISNCSDPSREKEFNYWYNHVHVPDVTGLAPLSSCIRFVNTDERSTAGKYVTTYEIHREDLSGVLAAIEPTSARLREMGRQCDLQQMVVRATFKRLGGEFRAATRPVRGILAVMHNCDEPATEAEYNRWYTDIHIPDVLDTGLYHTAYRYECLEPEASPGKYLTIYETDQGDPGKAGDELMKLRADWERRGRLFEGYQRVFRITARRVWPVD